MKVTYLMWVCIVTTVNAASDTYRYENFTQCDAISSMTCPMAYKDDTESLLAGDCDFKSFCGWSSKSNWKWVLDRYDHDHTTQRARGGSIKADNKFQQSEKYAQLSSPPFPPTMPTSRCLTFWFKFPRPSSSFMESLSVKVITISGKPNTTEVAWNLTLAQAKGIPSWQFGRTPIVSEGTHIIMFEAQRGPMDVFSVGTVFLDDVIFTDGPCSVEPAAANENTNATRPTTPPPPVEQPVKEQTKYDCTFEEKTLCNWEHLETSSVQWRIQTGSSSDADSGPTVDHTYGNASGTYILLKPSNKAWGANATLYSPKFPPSTANDSLNCLHFYYYMWGKDVQNLTVNVNRGSAAAILLWAKNGDQGPKWQHAQINITDTSSMSIFIQALLPKFGKDSFIAVDDIFATSTECQKRDDLCDFEDGTLCKYKTEGYAPLGSWKNSGGSAFSPNQVPDKDHTLNSGYGHYAIFQSNTPSLTNFAKLISPYIPTSEFVCLRFWYYISHPKRTSLVVVSDSNEGDILFHTDFESEDVKHNNAWQVTEITYETDTQKNDSFVFQGAISSGEKGDLVALDDIRITEGFCGYEGDCNFDNNDFCTWINDRDEGTFGWQLMREQFDHTMRQMGGYAAVRLNNEQRKDEMAVLYSQRFPESTTTRCLHFWYKLNEKNTGTLSISQEFTNTAKPVLIWSLESTHVMVEWNYAKAPFQGSSSAFRLVFTAIMGDAKVGEIAIDDVMVSDTDCSVEPFSAIPKPPTTDSPTLSTIEPNSNHLQCNFYNKDVCEWRLENYGGIMWFVGNLSEHATESVFIPPSRDMPDSYLYVESKFDNKKGKRAALTSNVLDPTGETQFCFSFWWYLFGLEAGNLTLQRTRFISPGEGGEENLLLWKRVGSQMDAWQKNYIRMNVDVRTQITFLAEPGNNGVIALDDFEVILSDCPVSSVCDFDADSCQWKDDKKSPLHWSRSRGPEGDHTTLTSEGYYMSVQNNPTPEKRIGLLQSTYYSTGLGRQCLTFWYYLNNSGSGLLSIHTGQNDNTLSEPLWTKGKDYGNMWKRAQVPLDTYSSFQIFLKASFPVSNLNDTISVDDISLEPKACDHPGTCDFESGYCGYVNDIVDDQDDWSIGYGRTEDWDDVEGPPFDSTGYPGNYLYVDMTNPNFVGFAKIRSDPIIPTPTSTDFCITFSYIAYGGGRAQLTVYADVMNVTLGVKQVLWEESAQDNEMEWHTVSVPVSSQYEFEIIFEAYKRSSHIRSPFIAIDNVLVKNSICTDSVEPPTNTTEPQHTKNFCDFESGKVFCDWNEDTTQKNMGWQVGNGGSVNDRNFYDHTLNSYLGHFMFHRTNMFRFPASLRLKSNTLTKPKYCFSFWYFIKGENVPTLSVEQELKDRNEVIWTSSRSETFIWRHGHVVTQPLPNSVVIIKGDFTTRSDGFIAVDDIDLVPGDCPPQPLCTFDEKCDFSMESYSRLYWHMANESADRREMPLDHTSNSYYGNYLYLNTTGVYSGQSSLIFSMQQPAEEACFRFWLYVGSERSSFTVRVHGIYLREIIGVIPNKWISVAVPVTTKSRDKWQVEMSTYPRQRMDIYLAVDDIEFQYNQPCGINGNCDFERDNCLWHNHPDNNLDWGRKAGFDEGNFFRYHFPKVDHTTSLRSGYYAYIYRKDIAFTKGPATFLSGLLYDRYRCFSFWYWASSSDVAVLDIFQDSGENKRFSLMSLIVNETNDKWHLARADIPFNILVNTEVFQIRINATLLNSTGVVALDDFKFHKESCDDVVAEEVYCHDEEETKIQQSQICDYVQDCSNNADEEACGSCDFETDKICRYSAITNERTQWIRLSATDAYNRTKGIAPSTDHSTGTSKGHYMIPLPPIGQLDVVPRAVTLHTPALHHTSSTCHIVFWYVVFLQEPNHRPAKLLQINLISNDGRKSSPLLTAKTSTEQGIWSKAEVYLGQVEESFTVEFNLDAHYFTKSAVAIDDVMFSACGYPAKSNNCTATKFKCNNSICIDKWQVCDFTQDCGDGSDEESCDPDLMWSFDSGLGNWTSPGNLWKITSGAHIRDHTTGIVKGYYISPPRYPGSQAELLSVTLKASSNCTVRFYYFLTGDGIASLAVQTRSFSNQRGKTYKLFDHFVDDNYFTRDQITFQEDLPFQIIFESKVTDGFVGIGLDDISFDSGCIIDGHDLNSTTVIKPDCVDKFQCKNLECLDKNLVCDFEPDCVDGSDEENCGSCDFEQGLCNWNVNSPGMFRWTRESATRFNNHPTLPDEDLSGHYVNGTFINGTFVNGHYMVVEKTTISHTPFPSAFLESPIFQRTGSSCKLSFWYHLSSNDGNLMVKLKDMTSKEEKTIALLTGSEGRHWRPHNITLGFLQDPRRIIFEADVNEQNADSQEVFFDFAIDNVEFFDCSSMEELNQTTITNLNCTFDTDGLCNWYDDVTKDDLNWSVASGSTPTKGTGPEKDHTNGEGNYIYLESTSKQSTGKTAVLLSSVLPPTIDHCLLFYYHMFGEHVNSLRVSLLTVNGTVIPIWAKLRSQSNSWMPGEVNINNPYNQFQIRFEGTTGDGPKGDIALDDIFLLDKPCKTVKNFCDFEVDNKGLCDWRNEEQGIKSKWEIKTGTDIKLRPNIDVTDHTTGTTTGHFLSATVFNKGQPATAKLKYHVSCPDDCCVSLWYSLFTSKSDGKDELSLKIMLYTNYGLEVNAKYGRNLWEYVTIPTLALSDFELHLTASYSGSFHRGNYFFAVDDIEFVPEQCPEQGACNFENGFCGWQNVKTPESSLDWLRTSGQTPSDNTGPKSDHTLENHSENGFYLFVDASRGNAGNQAILESPEFVYMKPDACFEFYYHMSGKDIGTLTISFISDNTTLVYSISGDQGDKWQPAYIELHNLPIYYRLEIAATVGSGIQGDIAIDDITMNIGNCTTTQFVLPPIMKLDTAASCQFENNSFCNWDQLTEYNFNWTIGNITIDDGASIYIPPSRNTENSYIFVESGLNIKPGMRAAISTPPISHLSGEDYCFSFWYYSFGSNVGNLSLMVELYGRFVIWKKVGAQMDAWSQAFINIDQPGNFTLVFEASIGSDGVIALDEFSVSSSRCPTVTVCTFEMDDCDWQANETDPLVWTFGHGSQGSYPYPQVDHSTGDNQGTYMLLMAAEGLSGRPAVGQFFSPLYPINFGTQCLQFWYYMSDSGLDSDSELEVYLQIDSLNANTEPLWRRSGDRWQRWHRAQITVGMYEQFQIVFQGHFTDEMTPAAIAIDDLQIIPSPCNNDASCPFDFNMCGYINDQENNFDWLLGSGRTEHPRLTSGPTADKSERGLYAYVDLTTSFAPPDGKATMRSEEIAVPVVGKSNSYCLQFFYVVYGKDLATLTIYRHSTSNVTPLTSLMKITTDNQVTDWTKMVYHLEADYDFEIIFEAKKGEDGGNAFIGIDSIAVTSGTQCEETPPVNTTKPENKKNFCDFESDCDWMHERTPNGSWQDGQGSIELLNETGPTFDHTTGTSQGHYQYIAAKINSPTYTAAVLESPATGAGSSCITFWYNIYGEHSGSLNVRQLINDENGKLLWTASHTEGRKWRYAQVELLPIPQTKAILKGIIDETDYNGFVAIDDINLLNDECPPKPLCTFDEGDSCGYEQPTFNEFAWIVSNGTLQKDHTTNTKYGKFYYTNTTGLPKDKVSATFTPKYSAIDSACLKFWYYMGSDSSKLSVSLHDGYKPIELTKLKGSTQKGEWMNKYAVINPRNDWQVEFSAISSHNPEYVFVALDDIEVIMDDTCQESVFCDFERDTCSWENSPQNFADWNRQAGYERHHQTRFPELQAPLIDHSTASVRGYYIYVANENQTGERARILSSVMQENFKCFSFWYMCTGDNVASLSLQMYTNVITTAIMPLPVNSTDSWQWQRWDILPPVSKDDFNFQLALTAQLGETNGVLALDDIQFHSKACTDLNDGEMACRDWNSYLKRSQWCDFHVDCDDFSDELECGNCDFDYNACSYVDVSQKHVRYEWTTAAKAHNRTRGAAPANDHSSNTSTGHYIVPLGPPDLTVENKGESAVLHSPLIQRASATCQLSFWAYLPPSATTRNHLQVSLIMVNGIMKIPIYEISRKTGKWEIHKVYIGRIAEPFLVEFLAQWNMANDAFAIDDIRFEKCDLQNGTEECSDDTMLPCRVGGCYDKNQQCDFTVDCGDGADEQNCDNYEQLRCDFEESSCVWRPEETSGFQRIKSATQLGNVPTRDHTTGISEGYFMLVSTKDNTEARLLGPTLQTKEKCTMRFYYYLNGSKDASLTVKAKNYTDGPEHVYMRRERSVGPYFVRDEVTFDEGAYFQVIIEATVEEGSQDIVALDDISFSSECFPYEHSLPKNPDQQHCDLTTKFQCKGTKNTCIPLDLLCDFHADCQDKSDESVCAACDFTSDQCGWIDTSPGAYRWQRYFKPQPRSLMVSDNPDRMGSWMMQVLRTRIGHVDFPAAFLDSHVFQETASTCSISFAYQLLPHSGELHLNLRNDKRNIDFTIMTLESPPFGAFETIQETIGVIPPDYQMVFEAKPAASPAPRIGIAVTDVNMVNCSKMAELKNPVDWDLNCNFEDQLYNCNWYQERTSDDINWIEGSGATPIKGTGPEQDHSPDGTGKYLYVTASSKETENKDAALVSRLVPSTGGRCLTFFYHMFGEHVNKLEVDIVVNNRHIHLWKKQNSVGNIWRPAEIYIYSDKPYQIFILGTTGIGEKSDIAIDDIKMLEGPCSDKDTYFCDFELDECGFSAVGDSLPWTLEHTEDHTTGTENGQALMSHLVVPTKNTSTESPVYPSSLHESCIQFWAKTSGFGNVNLNTSVFNENILINNRTTSMQRRDEWELVTVSVAPNSPFKVMITAYVKAGSESGTVFDQWFVDDFLVSAGACPTEGTCNFENGMCGWTDNDKFHWLRTSGNAPSDFGGPITDHTLEGEGSNLGFYLFLDSEEEDSTATLSSSDLDVGPDACFSLFYSIQGPDIGTLSVRFSYDDFNYINLHSISGYQGGIWEPFILDLHNITDRYWLQVVGNISGGKDGNMAIDDLLLTKGGCNISDFQPHVKPVSPTVMPKTPIITPKTPIITPKTPIITPKTPIITSKTPIINPETTTFMPKTPIVTLKSTPSVEGSTPSKGPLTTQNSHSKAVDNTGSTVHSGSSGESSSESMIPTVPNLRQNKTEAGFGWIAAVVFIIAIASTIGGLVWYKKHQQRMLTQGPISIDNPLFDDNADGYQPFAFHEPDTNVLTLMPDEPENEGRVNPLYREGNDPVSSSVSGRHVSSSDT